MSNKNESHHSGSYMVVRNLHAIKHALEEIMPLVDEHDDVESWMEHKVSVAKEALAAVRDALLYDDEEGEDADGGVDITILRGDDHHHDDMGLKKMLGGGCGANENKFYLGSGAINEKKQLVTNNSDMKVIVESVEKVGNMIRVTTKSGKSYEYMPHFGTDLELMRAEGYGIKIV